MNVCLSKVYLWWRSTRGECKICVIHQSHVNVDLIALHARFELGKYSCRVLFPIELISGWSLKRITMRISVCGNLVDKEIGVTVLQGSVQDFIVPRCNCMHSNTFRTLEYKMVKSLPQYCRIPTGQRVGPLHLKINDTYYMYIRPGHPEVQLHGIFVHALSAEIVRQS